MSPPQDQVEIVRLLTKHQRMIQAYAYAIVRDFGGAEDVYQEVAVIVATRWDAVPRGEGFLPWLRETTRRKALETRRKAKRMPPCLSEEILVEVGREYRPEARDSSEGGDLRDVLAGCLARLQETARAVVEARYGENRPCEEIAGRMGKTVQSVYAILKRARLALATCVDTRVPGMG